MEMRGKEEREGGREGRRKERICFLFLPNVYSFLKISVKCHLLQEVFFDCTGRLAPLLCFPKLSARNPIKSLIANNDKNSCYLWSSYYVPALSSLLHICQLELLLQLPQAHLTWSSSYPPTAPSQPSLLHTPPHPHLKVGCGKLQRPVSGPLHSLPW